MKQQFPLGQLLITPGALNTLDPRDVHGSIKRHACGDWGEVCEEDRQSNEEAVGHRLRILSVYHDRNGTKFWIITEADRAVTTVLLPDEY